MAKTYSQTYIFTQYNEYEKMIYEFIINAERIDTNSSEFSDILFDIKRRKISDALTSILTSPNVILGISSGKKVLPKALKTFVASDVKSGNKKPKAFIDVTDIIKYKDGIYECTRIDWLISYTISAMVGYIYAMQSGRLTGNATVMKDGCEAWMNCYAYIIDRMYKISTVHDLNNSLKYLACLYYEVNILERDFVRSEDSIKAMAIKISGIDPKQAKVVDINLEDHDFDNLKSFDSCIARILKLKDFKDTNVVSLWMTAFGTGTVFALEYFPAFATMLTDAYVGGYINQQMTIEKITGTSMVKFVKTILEIGANVV